MIESEVCQDLICLEQERQRPLQLLERSELTPFRAAARLGILFFPDEGWSGQRPSPTRHHGFTATVLIRMEMKDSTIFTTRIEEERQLVQANRRLIELFEAKIKERIKEVWGV